MNICLHVSQEAGSSVDMLRLTHSLLDLVCSRYGPCLHLINGDRDVPVLYSLPMIFVITVRQGVLQKLRSMLSLPHAHKITLYRRWLMREPQCRGVLRSWQWTMRCAYYHIFPITPFPLCNLFCKWSATESSDVFHQQVQVCWTPYNYSEAHVLHRTVVADIRATFHSQLECSRTRLHLSGGSAQLLTARF